MEEILIEKSCKSFIEALSSDSPTPGGASVAALIAALSVALGEMAGNISLSKKSDSEKEELKALICQGKVLEAEALRLIDEDKRCFSALMSIYKLPKSDDKKIKLQEGIKIAINPPIKIMEKTCEIIDLLNKVKDKSNKMLLSDVACGAICAVAALRSAHVNVLVNSNSLSNVEEKVKINSYVDSMLKKYTGIALNIYEKIKAGLI